LYKKEEEEGGGGREEGLCKKEVNKQRINNPEYIKWVINEKT
jgi:hypothetical protein